MDFFLVMLKRAIELISKVLGTVFSNLGFNLPDFPASPKLIIIVIIIAFGLALLKFAKLIIRQVLATLLFVLFAIMLFSYLGG